MTEETVVAPVEEATETPVVEQEALETEQEVTEESAETSEAGEPEKGDPPEEVDHKKTLSLIHI